LKKNGRLVAPISSAINKLEKARELYADYWLGFSEVELHQFARRRRIPEMRGRRCFHAKNKLRISNRIQWYQMTRGLR